MPRSSTLRGCAWVTDYVLGSGLVRTAPLHRRAPRFPAVRPPWCCFVSPLFLPSLFGRDFFIEKCTKFLISEEQTNVLGSHHLGDIVHAPLRQHREYSVLVLFGGYENLTGQLYVDFFLAVKGIDYF